MSKALRFLQITAKHQDFPLFYRISNDKNFIPKYLDNALTYYVHDFVRTVTSEKYCCKYNSEARAWAEPHS